MKAALALFLASALTLAVFAIWPQIDLATSALFYDGQDFPLAKDPALVALRWVLRVTPVLLALIALALVVLWRFLPDRVLGLSRRGWGLITLIFLLGPGLMANLLLKRYWGRARPRNVQEFGGAAQFTPPHQWADQCPKNCSFVSGEVSGATALSAGLIVLLVANRDSLPPWAFRSGLALAFVLPIASGFQRISAGAHFLSDAILAMLFTALLAVLLQRWLLPKHR